MSDPLDDFPAFAAQVRTRLEAGRAEYGDRSFDADPARLVDEVEQELLDVVGWAFILYRRLARRTAALRDGPRLVVVESPLKAAAGRSQADNEEYARLCMRDSLRRGEAPIASHALYAMSGVLDEADPEQRKLGIERFLASWGRLATLRAVYVDHGVSGGMQLAIDSEPRLPVERRRIL